jgi:SPP1 gp7 family putative phage head morphogenesis protein
MAEGMVKTILDGFYVQGKNPLQVARMLNRSLDEFEIGRARHTARTETGIAVEQSQHEVYKTSAVQKKRWVSTLDTKTREAHAKAHGQERPLDDPYIVGGEALMHPLDPNGSPENIVSCRCDSLPVLEGVEIVAEDIWDGS